MIIFENNKVSIKAKNIDSYETEIYCNDECLIVIETERLTDFNNKLNDVLVNFMI